MDRVVFVAASGAKQLFGRQTVSSNNLANANTIGFQADMTAFRTRLVQGTGFNTRAFAVDQSIGVSGEKGTTQVTGRTLDVAVNGNGWIAVQATDGSEAYTRGGSLSVNINGQLTTAAGLPVLGSDGPVLIPEYENLEIGSDGTISVRPIGQQPATLAEVSRIKMVSPPHAELVKGDDGLLRMRNGKPAPDSTEVSLISGSLENSNVNSVEAMADMISLARQYEMSIKIMATAKEMDEKATTLLSLS
ncbi:Flagellar basal-body rod protein FlgF [hydrothermal vent metagenome]|uniref:Flagellar basal-body rod protein FlgF n=1 Tax=hydrothermal vent metagenome TaxID=652676 RepID=A0A3B0Z726_9ZZZZ